VRVGLWLIVELSLIVELLLIVELSLIDEQQDFAPFTGTCNVEEEWDSKRSVCPFKVQEMYGLM